MDRFENLSQKVISKIKIFLPDAIVKCACEDDKYYEFEITLDSRTKSIKLNRANINGMKADLLVRSLLSLLNKIN